MQNFYKKIHMSSVSCVKYGANDTLSLRANLNLYAVQVQCTLFMEGFGERKFLIVQTSLEKTSALIVVINQFVA